MNDSWIQLLGAAAANHFDGTVRVIGWRRVQEKPASGQFLFNKFSRDRGSSRLTGVLRG
jgi:hypothetical protein